MLQHLSTDNRRFSFDMPLALKVLFEFDLTKDKEGYRRMSNPTDPYSSVSSETLVCSSESAVDSYVPPCIEEDLPLEVMSLACGGQRPKQASPLPCRTLGS